MHDERAWISGRVRLGRLLLAVGAAVVVVATVLGVADLVPGWDFRVVGGLGVLMLGLGLGLVMRYRSALDDDAAARRLVVEERDERTVQIRTRAGYRAWVVSAVFVWIGLMWASLAGRQRLAPPRRGPALVVPGSGAPGALRRLREQRHGGRTAVLRPYQTQAARPRAGLDRHVLGGRGAGCRRLHRARGPSARPPGGLARARRQAEVQLLLGDVGGHAGHDEIADRGAGAEAHGDA